MARSTSVARNYRCFHIATIPLRGRAFQRRGLTMTTRQIFATFSPSQPNPGPGPGPSPPFYRSLLTTPLPPAASVCQPRAPPRAEQPAHHRHAGLRPCRQLPPRHSRPAHAQSTGRKGPPRPGLRRRKRRRGPMAALVRAVVSGGGGGRGRLLRPGNERRVRPGASPRGCPSATPVVPGLSRQFPRAALCAACLWRGRSPGNVHKEEAVRWCL